MLVPTAEEMAAAQKMAAHSFVDVLDNGVMKPLAILTRANTDVPNREKNVAINIARKIPRFLDRPDLMHRRFDPIAIVAGGPSVKRHLDDIRKFRYVMAAGSSHDFLVANGINLSFAVSTDSKEETVLYFQKPSKNCDYLLASSGTPRLFDALKDYEVNLWHFNEQVDPPHYKGERSIGWGCMVGVVCIQMALWLGFQIHHYFGYDCCFEGEDTHSYSVSDEERAGIAEQTQIVTQGPEKTQFLTSTALICQMQHFYGVYKSQDNQFLKGYVYGRGLLWDNIRQSPPEMKHWLEAV